MTKPRLLRRGLILLVVLLCCELFAFGAARFLIVRNPLYQADAIVVLSGSSAFRERINRAAKLYIQGVASKIILTNDNEQGGWSNKLQRNPFFFERSQEQLLKLGVPKDAVEVLQQPVSSTQDEALLVKSYCDEHKLTSVLIVTSPYHSRRARWTFERALGAHGIKIGIDPVEIDSRSIATWWLHLSGWKMVPSEYVKMLYYRLNF